MATDPWYVRELVADIPADEWEAAVETEDWDDEEQAGEEGDEMEEEDEGEEADSDYSEDSGEEEDATDTTDEGSGDFVQSDSDSEVPELHTSRRTTNSDAFTTPRTETAP